MRDALTYILERRKRDTAVFLQSRIPPGGTLDDLTVDPAQDFRTAAALARAVRRSGHTVRSLTDCLIAAIALRHGTIVWHCDQDYARIAEVSGLQQRDLR